MAKTLVALLAALAVTTASLSAVAQTKKCPEGQVFDPDRGKCVTPRGSY